MYGIVYFTDFSSHSLTVSLYKQQLQIVHESFHTVPHIWNSLSNHVASADTVNTFKHRLDIFWSNQEVIYNYKADLVGTGNHSIIN